MLNNYGLGIGLEVKDKASKVFDRVGGKFSSMTNMFKKSGGILPKIFGNIQTKLTGFVNKIPGLGNILSKFGPQLAGLASAINPVTIAIGAAVAAFILFSKVVKEAIKVSSQFQYGMANISTLLDGDVSPKIEKMSKVINTMQIKYGQTANILQTGLYQTVSAFGDTTDAVKQLDIAVRSSVAGGSTVKEAISMLSSVTKGYGDTSLEAMSKVSDLAFMTVKLGETTFPELAGSMGRVVPLASSMGIGMEELFSVFATLTGVTGNTAEVSTQFSAILSGMIKPTKEMADIIKLLGYESSNAMLKEKGLLGTLDALKKSVGGNDQAFAKLLGRKEAIVASLALLNSQYDVFLEKSEKIKKAIGSREAAYQKMAATHEMSEKRLAGAKTVFMQSIGDIFRPMSTAWNLTKIKIIGGLSEMADSVNNNFIKPAKRLFSPFTAFMCGIFGVIGKYLLFVFKIGMFVFGIFFKVFTIKMRFIGAVFQGVIDGIKSGIKILKPAFDGLRQAISPIVKVFKDIHNSIMQTFGYGDGQGFDVMKAIATLVKISVIPVFKVLAMIIRGVAFLISFVLGGIVKLLNPALKLIVRFANMVKGIFMRIVSFISPLINSIVGALEIVLKPLVELAELVGLASKGTAQKWFGGENKFTTKVETPDIVAKELRLDKKMTKADAKKLQLSDEQLEKLESSIYKGSKNGSKEGLKDGLQKDTQRGWEMDFLVRNFIPIR